MSASIEPGRTPGTFPDFADFDTTEDVKAYLREVPREIRHLDLFIREIACAHLCVRACSLIDQKVPGYNKMVGRQVTALGMIGHFGRRMTHHLIAERMQLIQMFKKPTIGREIWDDFSSTAGANNPTSALVHLRKFTFQEAGASLAKAFLSALNAHDPETVDKYTAHLPGDAHEAKAHAYIRGIIRDATILKIPFNEDDLYIPRNAIHLVTKIELKNLILLCQGILQSTNHRIPVVGFGQEELNVGTNRALIWAAYNLTPIHAL
jgi:hypothetical protein